MNKQSNPFSFDSLPAAVFAMAEQIQEIKSLLIVTDKTRGQTSDSEIDERFLDTHEVAAIFGVSDVTIWSWAKKGILKPYRIGNLKRFKMSEILEAPAPIKRTAAAAQA